MVLLKVINSLPSLYAEEIALVTYEGKLTGINHRHFKLSALNAWNTTKELLEKTLNIGKKSGMYHLDFIGLPKSICGDGLTILLVSM